MKKVLTSLGMVLIIMFSLISCDSSKKLVVGGSTSVQALMEELAENYTGDVEVQGGGSTVGFSQTKDGVFNLGMLSRELKPEEKDAVNSVEIALDGIAVIVNQENKVNDLTMEQLKDIYTGKIVNWKELGGEDLEINVISRESGSGTRGAFEEIVKFKSTELVENAQVQNSTGAVENLIKSNKNSIGYISLGSLKSTVKALKINSVDPTVENIKSKEYKLVRPFIVVWTDSDDSSKDFREYILSNKGQEVIVNHKYISVK